MTKEERIQEVCRNSMNLISESLSKAIANAIEGGYRIGWEECFNAFKSGKFERL